MKSTPESSKPFIYLPDGALDGWYAAKAASATTPARVAVLGDSIAAGRNTSSYAKAWPNLIASYLQGQLGTYADYYSNAESPINLGPSDSPWGAALNAASWSQALWLGWHGAQYISAAFANWAQRFTTPYACTAFDLWYVDSYPGTWQYRVDGGSGVTVTNTSASSTAANTAIKKVSVTGLANTTHTIDIGQSSANAACMPMGITIYKPGVSGGLACARMSASGSQLNHLLNGTTGSNQMPADRLRLWQGVSPVSDAGTGTGTGFPMQPHLLIVALGVNDCNTGGSGNTQANFITGGRRLVQALRRANDNASVLFLIACNPDSVNSDGTGPSGADSWYSYYDYYYQAARNFNCAVVNIHARWGETPVGKGFMQASNLHPLDAGHADIATLLKTIL